MTEPNHNSPLTATGDAEAIKFLEQAITSGKHWYIALLEAIGLWASTEENYNGHAYRYLIDGEAFDWMLLAERLCQTVDSQLPESEKNALLFYGKPPVILSPSEARKLVGDSKYHQYLNYFYGVVVEGMLLLAVQEEVQKERLALPKRETQITDEAYRRIYDATKAELFRRFRQEKGYPQLKSTSIAELKEFTYWLFKYRLEHCEKAKVASDTKKSLTYLKRQWLRRGPFSVLATDEFSSD